MHKNNLTVVGIAILFLGTCITPSVAIDNVKKPSIPISSFNTLYVGGSGEGNYTKIQDAIDDASDGDTVFVYNDSSPYYENVHLYKSINLTGENRITTVIDANYSSYDVVIITADRVKVSGFTIRNSSLTGYGIHILSKFVTIISNIISNNGWGITLEDSYNVITGNMISNNFWGIYLINSNNNIIIGNSFFNDGLSLDESYNNIIENNMVNGKPLIYLKNRSNHIITDAGQVILLNCNNITIENLSLSNTDTGISLLRTNNSKIMNNNCSSNYFGIKLGSSSNNIISNNIISNNYGGIGLIDSSNNTIMINNISNNWFDGGLSLLDSNSNIILNNNFLYNIKHSFFVSSFYNRWKQNYWNRPRILPKLIFGIIIKEETIWIPWINIDWYPAKEPYDI